MTKSGSLSVCLTVCWQLYVKATEQIFVKISPYMYLQTRKNRRSDWNRPHPDPCFNNFSTLWYYYHNLAHICGKLIGSSRKNVTTGSGLCANLYQIRLCGGNALFVCSCLYCARTGMHCLQVFKYCMRTWVFK